MKKNVQEFLRAISSTFFLADPVVGAALVALVLVFDPLRAVLATVAAVGTHLVGAHCGANKSLLAGGLFYLNGWFSGLAVSLFFAGPLSLTVTLLCAILFTAFLVIALDRVLKVFDLPLLVLPFTVAIWAVYFLAEESAHLDLASLSGDSHFPMTLASHLHGLFVGVSQIFLVDNVFFGIAMTAILATRHLRMTAVALGASLLSLTIASVFGLPAWQLTAGLPVFPAFLLVAAGSSSFKGLTIKRTLAFAVIGGLLESITLRSGLAFGFPALSVSYVILAWLCVTSQEVRERQRDSWGNQYGI